MTVTGTTQCSRPGCRRYIVVGNTLCSAHLAGAKRSSAARMKRPNRIAAPGYAELVRENTLREVQAVIADYDQRYEFAYNNLKHWLREQLHEVESL